MDPAAVRERVMKSFFAGNRQKLAKLSSYDMIMGFVHAIDWKEPLIATGVAAYICLWIAVILTRKNWNAQFGLFGTVCAAVWAAPHINAALRRDDNWQAVGFTQNYFDERGVFISAMYSGPLLVIAMAQMLYAFTSAASLLITVKKKEIERRRGNTNVAGSPASVSSDPAPLADAVSSSASNEEPKALPANKAGMRRRNANNAASPDNNNDATPTAASAGEEPSEAVSSRGRRRGQ